MVTSRITRSANIITIFTFIIFRIIRILWVIYKKIILDRFRCTFHSINWINPHIADKKLDFRNYTPRNFLHKAHRIMIPHYLWSNPIIRWKTTYRTSFMTYRFMKIGPSLAGKAHLLALTSIAKRVALLTLIPIQIKSWVTSKTISSFWTWTGVTDRITLITSVSI